MVQMLKAIRGRRVGSIDWGSQKERLPLVVFINGLDNCKVEADILAGIAAVDHLGVLDATRGRIEGAVAVVVQSLAFLPRGVQKRLRPTQLLVCVGSSDKSVDLTLADELGLRLIHVDISRADEVADSVMAMLLGLLRRTHVLAAQGSACPEWLGGMQVVCKGMKRLRGKVLGIIGVNTAARAVARRALGFGMHVMFFDAAQEEIGSEYSHIRRFPALAEYVDNLEDLLASADIISLHAPLVNQTVQMINADTIKLIKTGAVIINTAGNLLIDDTAAKIALNEGRLGGIALDGVDGPSWMEAWVREMPNVLILPHSCEHSEEVWVEMRSRSAELLRVWLLEGTMPEDSFVIDELSAEDELLRTEAAHGREMYLRMKAAEEQEKRGGAPSPPLDVPRQQLRVVEEEEEEQQQQMLGLASSTTREASSSFSSVPASSDSQNKESLALFTGTGGGGGGGGAGAVAAQGIRRDGGQVTHPLTAAAAAAAAAGTPPPPPPPPPPPVGGAGADADAAVAATAAATTAVGLGVGKKGGRKRSGGKSHRKPSWGGEPPSRAAVEAAGALSREVPRTDFAPTPAVAASSSSSSSSLAPAPGQPRRRPSDDSAAAAMLEASALREGAIVALRARNATRGDTTALFYAARQRGPGRGWVLDAVPKMSAEDPSCQFLVTLKKDKIGLRSVTADGKLLQANKKGELVFINHNFDAWEGWVLEGPDLSSCRLVNAKFRGVFMEVSIQVLACMGDEDGVVRWRM